MKTLNLFGNDSEKSSITLNSSDDFKAYIEANKNIRHIGGMNWVNLLNLTKEQYDIFVEYFSSQDIRSRGSGPHVGLSNNHLSSLITASGGIDFDNIGVEERDLWIDKLSQSIACSDLTPKERLDLRRAGKEDPTLAIGVEWQKEILTKLREVPDRPDIERWELQYHH